MYNEKSVIVLTEPVAKQLAQGLIVILLSQPRSDWLKAIIFSW